MRSGKLVLLTTVLAIALSACSAGASFVGTWVGTIQATGYSFDNPTKLVIDSADGRNVTGEIYFDTGSGWIDYGPVDSSWANSDPSHTVVTVYFSDGFGSIELDGGRSGGTYSGTFTLRDASARSLATGPFALTRQ